MISGASVGDSLKQVVCGTPDSLDEGRRKALAQLFRTYERPLMAFIEKKLPPQIARVTDAHDVFQDTMFQACRRVADAIPAVGDAGFAWLKTVAHHRIVDLVRVHNSLKNGGGPDKNGVSAEVAAAGLSLWCLLEHVAICEHTPSKSAASREEARLLAEAIGRLMPDHQSVIRWRFIECLSVEETAKRFGRSEGAVQMLSARALTALRLEMRSLASSDSMHAPA